MKKSTRIAAIFMLGIMMFQNFCVTSYAAEQDKDERAFPSGVQYSDIKAEIENYVSENIETTAGMSVAVYDEDGVIYKNNFGYKDKENAKEVDSYTVFEWGSVSKLFIWISAMQLAEQGKLDLEEDIQAYLPENFLKNLTYDKKITMLDLMNHQAGFQETYIGMQTTNKDKVVSLEEALSKHQPKQVYEPGTVTAYSNWGASLAAYIVQNISKLDYVDYVHQNIFEPLGMKHTIIGATLQDNAWVSRQRQDLVCYDTNGDKIEKLEMCYVILYPAGSATGTIEDFLTFAQAITPNDNTPCPLFENQETLELMYTPTSYYGDSGVPNNYHGFFANQYGVETLGHGGNTFGCSSMLQFDPESGVGMVVMTNQAHEQIYNYDMYELLFGKFTDSELADIERDVPEGFVSFARTVKEGPLSFMSAMSISSYSEEDLNSWWYQEGDYIYGGYGDIFISTGKIITNLAALLLFVLSGVYGVITLIGGGLICSSIQKAFRKRKGIEKNHPFRKWNYAMSGIMAIIIVDFIVMFMRLNNGGVTGEMGCFEGYMIQSGIIAVMSVGLIAGLISGLVYLFKKGIADTGAEKVKYCITAFMSICMLVSVFVFDMYQFWAI